MQEERNLMLFFFKKVILFSCVLFFVNIYAQDSIQPAKDLTEEKELKFQQFFFKALSQKSIGNYQKAIENLESCNQILPNNTTVYFEFSKNYLELNNTDLAKEYINRALEKKPNNSWMQKHLVKIFVRERNFNKAIHLQKKIALKDLTENTYLVLLFLQNRDYKGAKNLIHNLEKENLLTERLKRIKDSLERRNSVVRKKESKNSIEDLFLEFKKNKTFKVLQQILNASKNNTEVLLEYSKEGMELFPSQPLVYLIQGKTLNSLKKYKEALAVLKNGIDFVIEESIEAEFYKEISVSFKGLGNNIEEKKFYEKYKKLKS